MNRKIIVMIALFCGAQNAIASVVRFDACKDAASGCAYSAADAMRKVFDEHPTLCKVAVMTVGTVAAAKALRWWRLSEMQVGSSQAQSVEEVLAIPVAEMNEDTYQLLSDSQRSSQDGSPVFAAQADASAEQSVNEVVQSRRAGARKKTVSFSNELETVDSAHAYNAKQGQQEDQYDCMLPLSGEPAKQLERVILTYKVIASVSNLSSTERYSLVHDQQQKIIFWNVDRGRGNVMSKVLKLENAEVSNLCRLINDAVLDPKKSSVKLTPLVTLLGITLERGQQLTCAILDAKIQELQAL